MKVRFADGKIQPRIKDKDDRWLESFKSPIVYRNRFRADEIEEARELRSRLSNWKNRLNDRLFRFAETLSAFKELREVKIEATLTPRWRYINAALMGRLLTSLPSNVKTLTLDTHACHFTSELVHLCDIISQRLHNFETVRIRMRSICPAILEPCINSPNTTSRLTTLVIRLYLPDYVGPGDIRYGEYSDFQARPCYPGEPVLFKDMVLAGFQLTNARPSMTGVRVSFRPHGQNPIVVADCKEEVAFYHPETINYKDGALVEGPWEDSLELQHDANMFWDQLPY